MLLVLFLYRIVGSHGEHAYQARAHSGLPCFKEKGGKDGLAPHTSQEFAQIAAEGVASHGQDKAFARAFCREPSPLTRDVGHKTYEGMP